MTNYNNIDTAKKQANQIPFAAKARVRSFPSALTSAEWAQIAPSKVIVATENLAWLYHPRSADVRFTKPMEGAGSIPTTSKLLDGAYAPAFHPLDSNLRKILLNFLNFTGKNFSSP